MKVSLEHAYSFMSLRNMSIAAILSLSLTACGGGGAGNPALSTAPSVSTQSIASAPQTSQTYKVSVSYTNPLNSSAHAIDKTFAGLSFEKRDLSDGRFNPSDATFQTLFRTLGGGIVRIGGASGEDQPWSDTCPAIPDRSHPVICTTTLLNLKSFLDLVGWKVIYMLPLKQAVTDYHNDVAQNINPQSDLNADFMPVKDEAVHVASILGNSLSAFEVGNEPDFYSGVSTSDYAAVWNQYVTRIQQSVSGAKNSQGNALGLTAQFIGPSTAGDPGNYFTPTAQTNVNVVALCRHLYALRGGVSTQGQTTDQMLQDSQQLLHDGSQIQAILGNAAQLATASGKAFQVGETNSASQGGIQGVSNGFTSALWSIDYLFTLADMGASGANFHSSGSAQTYAPIAGDFANPEFYGLLFFNQAAVGGKILSPAAASVNPASNPNVEVRVIYVNGNQEKLVLMNKDPNTSLTARVYLPALSTNASADAAQYKATLTLLTAGLGRANSATNLALATTGITFGGSPVASDGSWTGQVVNLTALPMANPNTNISTSVTVVVPPMSAGLMKITH